MDLITAQQELLDRYINKDLLNKVQEFLPEIGFDHMGGVWELCSDDNIVYCTPFYEGCEGIAITIIDHESKHVSDSDLPFELTLNVTRDAKEYVKTIRQFMKYNEMMIG